MPAFAYHAVDRSGRRVRGREAAATSEGLARILEERGWLVLDVEATQSDPTSARIAAFRRRRAVLDLTRALAALLPAGMPLARALAAASNVAAGPMAPVLTAVRERVEHGDSVAAALAAHPTFFSPLYVGLVRAGERSGDLAGAFTRLADQLEREDALRGRLLSLSIYPLLLATLGGIAVVVLLLFVLPRFVELLQGAGATLPRSTAIMLQISTIARHDWPALLIIPMTTAAGAAWYRGSDDGRRAFAALVLHLPVIGTLRRHALAARFARLTGTLVGGGAPLFAALGDTIDCLDDPIARGEADRIRTRVREGVAFNRAIAEGTLFPPLLAQLVAVGEDAGRLEEFLLKTAALLEDTTERTTQRLVTLLEPAMIVAFGAVVAFVALSLLQAIYGVNASAFR
jgi:general secretion pathway protein F